MYARTRLRRISAILLAVVLLGVVLAGAPARAVAQVAENAPLQVSDVLDISTFADRNQLDLSPDGSLVAFALTNPRRAAEPMAARYFDDRGVPRGHRGTDVYVTDVETGRTRRLGDGSGSSWSPIWSPDGRYLAFYSDRDGLAKVWLWDRERDATVKLSDEVVRSYFGFEQIEWSPGGRRILVKVMPEGASFDELRRLFPAPAEAVAEPSEREEEPVVTARAFHYEPDRPVAGEERPSSPTPVDVSTTRSFLNVELSDLALIEVPSGNVRRIARDVRAMGYRFAPAGDRVAFSTRQPDGGTGMLVYNRYDLSIVDTDGGPARSLAPKTVQEYGLGFSWSPDGESIAYVSDGAVRVVSATDGSAVRSFAREGISFEHGYRPPFWEDDETLLVTAADTVWRLSLSTAAVTSVASPPERRLLQIVAPISTQRLTRRELVVSVSDPRSKRSGLQRLDLRTGRLEPLFEKDLSLAGGFHLDPSDDGRTVAFVAQSGARPSEVWIASGDLRAPRRATDLHAGISDREMGRSRLIDWKDARGNELQGALLLPPGYEEGRRYPLVVKIYGGSLLSRTVNRFGLQGGVDNLQLLATRGYAVLLADTPTRQGTPMTDIAEATISGIDAAIAAGVADPDRIAVLGHSYGGYSALAVAVSEPRLRAVISSGGFSNLFGQYTAMRPDGSVVGIYWAEQGQGKMAGHAWEYRRRYVDNSPFFLLDRVAAPVLILHGGADSTVLPPRAQETFVGLRRLGKEVKLVIYDGEGHHPGSWSIENATDYWDQIFDWLERHMDGGP